ncbi:hypothetical protein D3C81_1201750 [compost metagenome]
MPVGLAFNPGQYRAGNTGCKGQRNVIVALQIPFDDKPAFVADLRVGSLIRAGEQTRVFSAWYQLVQSILWPGDCTAGGTVGIGHITDDDDGRASGGDTGRSRGRVDARQC